MANFKYAAKDPSGKTVEGVLTAESQGDVLGQLRSQNLVPIRVTQAAGKAKGAPKGGAKKAAAPAGGGMKKKGGGLNLTIGKVQPTASRQELVMFTRQLATMIGAGLSLLESLDVLGEQAESPGLEKTCGILVDELRGGADLSSAMEKCPKAFSPLYISMVRAGEASGQMDIILDRLADYVESSDELRREVKSAMTYPVISLVLVLGITAFLMLGVVPTFRQVFESLDTDLPKLTELVLAASDWMRANWGQFFGGMFIAAGAFMGFKKTQKGSEIMDMVMLKLPVFGQMNRKVALARFSRTFATLTRSGVPIMGTLDIVSETAGNSVVSKAVIRSRESVKNGNMLSEPLSESPVFPPMVVRMIAIGERSGALEQLLEKIADFYDAQVKAQIKSLTSLIEPLLISFMGVVVGGVVLAVFLPILDIVGQLGGGGS